MTEPKRSQNPKRPPSQVPHPHGYSFSENAPSRRLPVITLLLAGGGVVAASFPGLTTWLVYDRSAILSGEIWRMYTGHWVHFSASQLGYDLLALVIAGWIIEAEKLPHFGWLCLVAPWFISAELLLFDPEMRWFGGLSALATAALVYLALFGLHDKGLWRWMCLTALLGFGGKILFEMITGQTMFVTAGTAPLKVSVASHVSGALVAFLFYGWSKIFTGKETLISCSPHTDCS